MITHKKKDKSINLNKLKKGIDLRIQAILKYLENQPNDPKVSQTKIDNSVVNKTEQESTTINRDSRQSLEIDTELSTERLLRQQSLGFDEQRPQELYERRASLNADQFSQNLNDISIIKDSQTPQKVIESQAIENSQNSITNSQQSYQKKKIEQNAEFKIFDAPLNDTSNLNGSEISEIYIETFLNDLKNINVLKSNTNISRIDTSRSKNQKTNKQNHGTPFSKTKSYKKSQFSHHLSDNKKLYNYLQTDSGAKIIPYRLIENMKEEIDKIGKNMRKQANENNARSKLLKRIQSFKTINP